MRLVSLPMYAIDHAVVERFWEGLRGHLLAAGLADVPDTLTWPDDVPTHWRDPNLLLSQTCGYPLTTSLAGRVTYVATPRFRADGCAGASYRSVLLVRDDDAIRSLADAAGRRVAFNGTESQSGYNGLRAMVAPLAREGRFFAAAIATGGHRASVRAVRMGQADLAAIDAVTAALLRRYAPAEMAGLRAVGFTPAAAGLPFVTALATAPETVERLRAALAATTADPAMAEVSEALLLEGFDVLESDAYAAIPAMQASAEALGYPFLA